MIITKQYVRDKFHEYNEFMFDGKFHEYNEFMFDGKFHEYNELMFDGKLPPVPIKIGISGRLWSIILKGYIPLLDTNIIIDGYVKTE